MGYLGHRKNAHGFYIYEYVLYIELFRARVHVFGRLLLHPLLLSMSVSFTVDSVVRGNHIYKAI